MERDGHTNTVEERTDGTILKQFPRRAWTVHVMDLLKALLFSIGITTRQDRIRNEVAAKPVLQEYGIPTQTVIDRTDTHLLLDRVPGDDLHTVLQHADEKDCFAAGKKKGRELRTVHDNGHAYIDCRCGNTIIDGDTLYSIDHELFVQNATQRIQLLDRVTLLGTAKQLPKEGYRPFLQGFQAGYAEDVAGRWRRAVLELPCATGYAALVEKDIRSVGRVLRNWTSEHVLRAF